MGERDIGVALSGGGHRSTVFSLGALLAMADTGLNNRTMSIASVSGGSVANGTTMVGPDFGISSASDVEAHFAQAVASIAHRGVLQGGAPETRGYLRILVAAAIALGGGLLATLVGGFGHFVVVLLVGLVLLVGGGVAAWRLFGQRSVKTERAIDVEALGNAKTTLADQQRRNLSVHHVLCTTELQTGTAFFFSNRLVYGDQFGGSTGPCALPLSTAVQASACVPGAFRARDIDLSVLGLQSVNVQVPVKKQPGTTKTVIVTQIVVDDGGVYDNMADEWDYGFANRAQRRWTEVTSVQSRRAPYLLVINGSGGWDRMKPIVSRGPKYELDGLLRAKDVQYDVSTAHRRRALADDFIASTRNGDSIDDVDGTFIQITADPYRLPTKFGPKPGHIPDEKANRATEALAFLDNYGLRSDGWDELVHRTSGVPTTLKALGSDVCVDLLEHAYILTTVNTYVVLGLGKLPTASRADLRRRFAAMCTKRA